MESVLYHPETRLTRLDLDLIAKVKLKAQSIPKQQYTELVVNNRID